MIRGWADPDTIEAGKGRHQWLLVQAIRLYCAKFGGCITEEDFDHAKTVLEDTSRYLRESPCKPRRLHQTRSDSVRIG